MAVDKEEKRKIGQRLTEGRARARKEKSVHRFTWAQIQRRVTEVYGMLLEGYNRKEIKDFYSDMFEETGEPYWNVSMRSIDKDIAKANKIFKREAETDRKRELGITKNRYEELYKRTLKKGDEKTALAVEKARVELFGLDHEERQEEDETLQQFVKTLNRRSVNFRGKSNRTKRSAEDEDEDEDEESDTIDDIDESKTET